MKIKTSLPSLFPFESDLLVKAPCELFLDNAGFAGDVLAAVFGGVIDLADGERTTFGGLESIFLTSPFVFTAPEDSVTFERGTAALGDPLTGDFRIDFGTALSGEDNTTFGGVEAVKQCDSLNKKSLR